MLKPPYNRSGLIFWDDSNAFSTNVDREFWFGELARPSPSVVSTEDKACPGIHLESQADGIVISVVDSDHREEYSHNLIKQTVALIPWEELMGRESGKKLDARMAKNGWRREKDPEGIMGNLQMLHHKYFEVWWSLI